MLHAKEYFEKVSIGEFIWITEEPMKKLTDIKRAIERSIKKIAKMAQKNPEIMDRIDMKKFKKAIKTKGGSNAKQRWNR